MGYRCCCLTLCWNGSSGNWYDWKTWEEQYSLAVSCCSLTRMTSRWLQEDSPTWRSSSSGCRAKEVGLVVNEGKTNYLIVSRSKRTAHASQNFTFGGHNFERVGSYNHLGKLVTLEYDSLVKNDRLTIFLIFEKSSTSLTRYFTNDWMNSHFLNLIGKCHALKKKRILKLRNVLYFLAVAKVGRFCLGHPLVYIEKCTITKRPLLVCGVLIFES